MTTCLEKSCSVGLLCGSFVNVYQFMFSSFPLCFKGVVEFYLYVLVPDHCVSFYFSLSFHLS